jgi:hypothetical protein
LLTFALTFPSQFIRFNNSSSYKNVWKWLSSISLTIELMYPHSEKHDNNKKDRTKATAAVIPMIGAIVTAALLLSGLSLISSYQPAIAQQQNMTEGGGTEGGTTAGNATNVTAAGNATNVTAAGNATTAGNATNMTTGGGTEGGTTTGGPMSGPGEGSGGGAAGGGGTAPTQ